MAHEPAGPLAFGAELRRHRQEKGLSLTALAATINYSKSHLSKVESGTKAPSTDLARRCDNALEASGALTRLAPPPQRAPLTAAPLPDRHSEVWTMWMAPDGNGGFHAFDRRAVLTSTAASVMSWAITSTGRESEPTEPDLTAFPVMLQQLRIVGQTNPPATAIQIAIPLAQTLTSLASSAAPTSRVTALQLAARFAEYTGWMAQEDGDNTASTWWTNQAVSLALAGGDPEMPGYALVRQAEIALYRDDHIEVLRLARQAQEKSTTARVLGFAVQREAQGHALAGEEHACRNALDRATELVHQAHTDTTEVTPAVLGSTTMTDPVAFVTGWCLYDLGHPAAAAKILIHEFDRVPAHAHRARARYGARLALALAGQHEIDHACAIAETTAVAASFVNSATVRTDLRRLARTMNRWRKHPDVRRVMPRLASALHIHQTPHMG
jgi:transcriptional regulator with XRE-family HTH domain